jgi:hypothetical protein
MPRLTLAEAAELAELNPEIVHILESGSDAVPVPTGPAELVEWFRSTNLFRREAFLWMARDNQQRQGGDLADAMRRVWPAVPADWRDPTAAAS